MCRRRTCAQLKQLGERQNCMSQRKTVPRKKLPPVFKTWDCSEKCLTWPIFIFTKKSREISGPIRVCVCVCVFILKGWSSARSESWSPRAWTCEAHLGPGGGGGFTRTHSTLITAGIPTRSKSNSHVHYTLCSINKPLQGRMANGGGTICKCARNKDRNDRGNNALLVTRYLQDTDIKKCKELFHMVFHQEE